MISLEQLESVGGWLKGNGSSATLEQDLRGAFPDMHFTFCSDDDVMSDSPIADAAGFNLYLIDSSNHCLCLTPDPQTASGLVVAQVEDE